MPSVLSIVRSRVDGAAQPERNIRRCAAFDACHWPCAAVAKCFPCSKCGIRTETRYKFDATQREIYDREECEWINMNATMVCALPRVKNTVREMIIALVLDAVSGVFINFIPKPKILRSLNLNPKIEISFRKNEARTSTKPISCFYFSFDIPLPRPQHSRKIYLLPAKDDLFGTKVMCSEFFTLTCRIFAFHIIWITCCIVPCSCVAGDASTPSMAATTPWHSVCVTLKSIRYGIILTQRKLKSTAGYGYVCVFWRRAGRSSMACGRARGKSGQSATRTHFKFRMSRENDGQNNWVTFGDNVTGEKIDKTVNRKTTTWNAKNTIRADENKWATREKYENKNYSP